MSVSLTDPIEIGPVKAKNRVFLAPLAGIGNWFVRLQAKRYGAGFTFSEMVSSYAVFYGNERTCTQMLKVHPDEGPMGIQLFGNSPEKMAYAAEQVAKIGVDLIDINMGCPVPKVCKTGAGAALLEDQDLAVKIAQAAVKGSGLPVTVKLRPGLRPGERKGVDLAKRLVEEAGISALTFHPRHASQRHKGKPDYQLAREVIDQLPVPVIISGGLHTPDKVQSAFTESGAAAVVLARGSLGNPWLFRKVLTGDLTEPSKAEIFEELTWIVERARQHFGEQKAASYLRKFYPWYVERIEGEAELQDAMQRSESTEDALAAFRQQVTQNAYV